MADAPDNSSYILANPDSALADSRVLEAGTGLVKQDTGSGGTITIAADGNLATLATTTSPGYVICDTSGMSPVFVQRGLNAGTGITITQGLGQGGATTIAVTEKSTTQNVEVSQNGTLISTRNNLNFSSSGPISLTVQDDGGNDRTNITINGTSIAENDATYILQVPDNSLPNAQALSALSTGILKSTTTTGVVSIAVAGTDYQAPSAILTSIAGVTPAIGTLLVGNGTGFTVLGPGATNSVLTSNGVGAAPSYEPPVGGSGISTVELGNGAPTQTLASHTYYTANNSSQQVFVLPASPSAGEFYKIIGYGAGGWTVTQNAGQTIEVGNISTTTGTGGSITNILSKDSIDIYCVDANNFTAHITSGQVTVV